MTLTNILKRIQKYIPSTTGTSGSRAKTLHLCLTDGVAIMCNSIISAGVKLDALLTQEYSKLSLSMSEYKKIWRDSKMFPMLFKIVHASDP